MSFLNHSLFAFLTDTTALLAQEGEPKPPGMSSMLVPMVLMMVVFYFLLIRPQRKKQRELEEQVNAMKPGDRVITAGGMHGVVQQMKKEERVIVVQIAEKVRVEFDISGISRVIKKDVAKEQSSAS